MPFGKTNGPGERMNQFKTVPSISNQIEKGHLWSQLHLAYHPNWRDSRYHFPKRRQLFGRSHCARTKSAFFPAQCHGMSSLRETCSKCPLPWGLIRALPTLQSIPAVPCISNRHLAKTGCQNQASRRSTGCSWGLKVGTVSKCNVHFLCWTQV